MIHGQQNIKNRKNNCDICVCPPVVIPDVGEPLYGILGRLKRVLVVARVGCQMRQV